MSIWGSPSLPPSSLCFRRRCSFGIHLLGISLYILPGSLFVIAGAVVIKTSARGTPAFNTLFLLVGAVFANFIGTTGASMILIRPMIRANRWRKHKMHRFMTVQDLLDFGIPDVILLCGMDGATLEMIRGVISSSPKGSHLSCTERHSGGQTALNRALSLAAANGYWISRW